MRSRPEDSFPSFLVESPSGFQIFSLGVIMKLVYSPAPTLVPLSPPVIFTYGPGPGHSTAVVR